MNSAVFIAAISSDIGRALAGFYRAQGRNVIGTYRSEQGLEGLREDPGVHLIFCDLARPETIAEAAGQLAGLAAPWDTFIGAAGQLSPIGPFFGSDAAAWAESATLNGVAQLRLLHAVYPHRRAGAVAKTAFLVGGGINGPFPNYSAYCLGKLVLVKMCELLDEEYQDLHTVAIGTGWVDTKIHRQTMAAGEKAGSNLARTAEFLSSGKKGTTYREIFDCIEWCFAAGRAATGGRNFSVVHDAWRDGGEGLKVRLLHDSAMYKLRRHAN
jgi:NAD(P)-dependent dehydrogenase (short-subunit alcohol dehydrogenase family)